MALHFFVIPIHDSGAAQQALNSFCAAHRVVSLERQFVTAGADSCWALCVTVSEGPESLPDALKAHSRGAANGTTRLDYKRLLSETEFALFASLRSGRKSIAEREGLPVYAVFTNEPLAEIVRRDVRTLTALGEIDGIGPARLARYGQAVLACLARAAGVAQRGNEAPHAT